jgi:hypothetical protein
LWGGLSVSAWKGELSRLKCGILVDVNVNVDVDVVVVVVDHCIT